MTSEDYMASIGITAGFYAPVNTALCQGQLMPISQNDALFYLLNTTYGGDGQATFGLPNLAGVVPFGTGAQQGTSWDWKLGQTQPTLTAQAWPDGNPAVVQPGSAATMPTTSGPSGLALNWAITLYGLFPPRP